MKQLNEWISQLYRVNRADVDGLRRGQIIITLSFSMFFIYAFTTLLQVVLGRSLLTVLSSVVALLITGLSLWVTRRGAISLGAWLILLFSVIVVVAAPHTTFDELVGLYYLSIPIFIASLVLQPRYIWLLFVVIIGIQLWIFSQSAFIDFNNPDHRIRVLSLLIMPLVTAIIGYIGSRAITNAFNTNMQQSVQLRQQTRELETLNSRLEQQVQTRTSELEKALADVKQRSSAQQQLLEQVQTQRALIRDMSVPLLPLTKEVLVLPLIGDLDAERLSTMQDAALSAVESTHATFLILDITGVTVIDTFVARGIIEAIRSLAFLGAETILVGVRPEVAQAIVSLGLDFGDLQTASDLQGAMSLIDAKRGFKARNV